MEFTTLLLWLHFVAMAAGLGAGIALAVTGPLLVKGPPDQRPLMWHLEKVFSRIGLAGLATLLVTGPLMVWLRYGGFASFTWWFWVKMAFVAATLIGVAVHTWAAGRFQRGDATAVPLMFIGGRVGGVSMVLVILSAVLTFN